MHNAAALATRKPMMSTAHCFLADYATNNCRSCTRHLCLDVLLQYYAQSNDVEGRDAFETGGSENL